MKVKVLASGSKGNCTYIECDKTKILIDAGISYQQIKVLLDDINVSINDINILLLTHSHNDHIKGLSTLLKKTKIILYLTENVYSDIYKKMEISNFHIIDKEFMINDVEVELLHLSHDVECYGYIISHNNKQLVYITDTGYLNRKYYSIISNKDIYIIEANHDEKMLMDGPYPFILKQRIISDRGHLSNNTTGRILSKVIGPKTKYIFLAHISEHNNTKELALQQVKDYVSKSGVDFNNFIITDQYISLDMIEV